MRRGDGPRNDVALAARKRIRKAGTGRAQKNEKFSGPQQNVQQAPALQIAEFRGAQAHVESLMRALLHERAHLRELRGFRRHTMSARIHAVQLFVAAPDKVIQAKILLSQGSNRVPCTRIHTALSVRQHLFHGPQAQSSNFIAVRIIFCSFHSHEVHAKQVSLSSSARTAVSSCSSGSEGTCATIVCTRRRRSI